MEKNFSDNTLLPTINTSKSVSFSLDNPDIPSKDASSPLPLCNLSEIHKSNSKNYNTRDTRPRRQSMKDYRAFLPQSKISDAFLTHKHHSSYTEKSLISHYLAKPTLAQHVKYLVNTNQIKIQFPRSLIREGYFK